MKTLCNTDCCLKCRFHGEVCAGCAETDGHPCGGACVAADCVKRGGQEALQSCKQKLIDEINALGIPELQVAELYLLNGAYVNLEYTLPGGEQVRFLNDKNVYWGCQVERPGRERCYGLVADDRFLLVCEYGCEGAAPEIVLFKRRQEES